MEIVFVVFIETYIYAASCCCRSCDRPPGIRSPSLRFERKTLCSIYAYGVYTLITVFRHIHYLYRVEWAGPTGLSCPLVVSDVVDHVSRIPVSRNGIGSTQTGYFRISQRSWTVVFVGKCRIEDGTESFRSNVAKRPFLGATVRFRYREKPQPRNS